jgi:hypothetical protein
MLYHSINFWRYLELPVNYVKITMRVGHDQQRLSSSKEVEPMLSSDRAEGGQCGET